MTLEALVFDSVIFRAVGQHKVLCNPEGGVRT